MISKFMPVSVTLVGPAYVKLVSADRVTSKELRQVDAPLLSVVETPPWILKSLANCMKLPLAPARVLRECQYSFMYTRLAHGLTLYMELQMFGGRLDPHTRYRSCHPGSFVNIGRKR
jgi:hypothetical protein